jgi:hypothetical protein
MPKKARKKPLITKNWLPIEYIHGVPNVKTSFVMLANMKKERAAAGKPPSEIKWCVFCGRAFKNIQARIAHLKHCEKRRIYKSTKAEGWHFTIGSRVFTVRTLIWCWIREAASLEAEFSQRIADGSMTEAEAVTRFNYFVLGHQATYPRADAMMEEASPGIPAGESSSFQPNK